VLLWIYVKIIDCLVCLHQEQLTGAEYNEKSDVWSLGCILYELCALRPPFTAESHLELVKNVTSGQLQQLPAVYSVDLFTLISSLLRVNVCLVDSLYYLCIIIGFWWCVTTGVAWIDGPSRMVGTGSKRYKQGWADDGAGRRASRRPKSSSAILAR